MLQKSKSKTIAKFKYLILVPILLLMLTYVSCTTDENSQPVEMDGTISAQIDNLIEQVEAKGELTKKEKIKIELLMHLASRATSEESKSKDSSITTVHEQVSEVPFSVIDQVPIYPGCEGLAGNEEQKKCMSEKITEHVSNNFNTKMGKELGLTGQHRVIVQFKINKNGEIIEVRSRAPHPKLEEEAKRVINSIPQMIPGKQNGTAVGVVYSLPIVFQVSE